MSKTLSFRQTWTGLADHVGTTGKRNVAWYDELRRVRVLYYPDTKAYTVSLALPGGGWRDDENGCYMRMDGEALPPEVVAAATRLFLRSSGMQRRRWHVFSLAEEMHS